MATQTRVLSPASEMLATVRDSGNAPKRGFSRISRASYSSSSTSSVTGHHETVEIPEELNSQATLEFFGFDESTAKTIFEAWRRMQQQPGELGYGNDIITEAEYYIKRMAAVHDAWLPGRNWRQALTEMGIAQSLCDVILDDAFENIRKSKSASHWILDTFRTAWEFLDGLDKKVRHKKEEMD